MINEISSDPSAAPAVSAETGGRLVSLDVLRGFDMFWIAGMDRLIWTMHDVWPSGFMSTIYMQFEHKEWEGFAFYDLIFPLFIFMVGISTVFSLSKILNNEGKAAAYKRIFRRFLLLYLLALLYNGSFWGEHVRLFGVLHRIAWCYLFTSLLFCHLRLRGLVVVFAGILVGYWALLTFVPPPGEAAPTFEIHRNWANWIDKHYLPAGDMESRGWRNEGILSTIPAVATCLLGLFTGLFLKDKRIAHEQKPRWLVVAGIALVAAGFLWGIQFPVIKRIWTSTYVLVAGGYSCILLGVFYWIVDVKGWRRWTPPFVWIGTNAIVAYMITGMVPWRFIEEPVTLVFALALGGGAKVLAAAIIPATILLITFGLYRKRLFLRV